MIRALIETPDGGELIVQADEMICHNVIQDTTRPSDVARSFEASGDQIVVLVKRGERSRVSDRIDMALTCMESVLKPREEIDDLWTR